MAMRRYLWLYEWAIIAKHMVLLFLVHVDGTFVRVALLLTCRLKKAAQKGAPDFPAAQFCFWALGCFGTTSIRFYSLEVSGCRKPALKMREPHVPQHMKVRCAINMFHFDFHVGWWSILSFCSNGMKPKNSRKFGSHQMQGKDPMLKEQKRQRDELPLGAKIQGVIMRFKGPWRVGDCDPWFWKTPNKHNLWRLQYTAKSLKMWELQKKVTKVTGWFIIQFFFPTCFVNL